MGISLIMAFKESVDSVKLNKIAHYENNIKTIKRKKIMRKYILIAGLLASTQVQAVNFNLNALADEWLSKKTKTVENVPAQNQDEVNEEEIANKNQDSEANNNQGTQISNNDEPIDTDMINLTKEDYIKWGKFKIDEGYKIRAWKSVGVNDPEEAVAWEEENFRGYGYWGTSDHLKLRNEYKVKNADDVHALAKKLKLWMDKNRDFTFSYALMNKQRWNEIGITTPEKKKLWEDNGFEVGGRLNPKWWIQVGITDPVVAIAYENFYITPQEISKIKYEDIKEWQKIGVKNMASYNSWASIGLDTPQKVAPWLKTVGDNSSSVELIVKAGFKTPAEYAPYSKIKAFEHLQMLKELKMTPTPLIESMSKYNKVWDVNLFFSSKENFIEAHNTLKSQCQQIEYDFFTRHDAYGNKGKCYIFAGTMFQRLSANTGLVKEYGNQYMHTTFSGDWMDNKGKFGVVKGEGAFSYTATNGKASVVPKGKVIFSK
jgi:hypothetical protein